MKVEENFIIVEKIQKVVYVFRNRIQVYKWQLNFRLFRHISVGARFAILNSL